MIPPAVVLVEPRKPGNLGAAARVMANFGLERLIVAGPTELPAFDDEVSARVEGRRLLASVERSADLATALSGFQAAIAVTRRTGKHRPTDLAPAELRPFIESLPAGTRTALVFGREADGLRADEVLQCGRLISIPTTEEAPSLNLAQAVAVAAFAWHSGNPAPVSPPVAPDDEPAPATEIEALFAALAASLNGIGFLEGDRGDDAMASLRRLFGRAVLTRREVRLLRGLARKIDDPQPPQQAG